jgi:hypothetical protein
MCLRGDAVDWKADWSLTCSLGTGGFAVPSLAVKIEKRVESAGLPEEKEAERGKRFTSRQAADEADCNLQIKSSSVSLTSAREK